MIKKILTYITIRVPLISINNSQTLTKIIGTTFVRGLGVLLGALLSIILARTLGAQGLGIINLSNHITGIILMLIMLGFPTVILKEVSIAVSRKDWNYVGSVMNTAFRVTGLFGLIIITIILFLIPYFTTVVFDEPDLKIPLTIFVFVTIFQIFSKIFIAGVNGHSKIWQSNLADKTFSLFLILIFIGFQNFFNSQITVITVAIAYGIARVIAAISIGMYWNKIHIPPKRIILVAKKMFKVALPLLFLQATNTIASSVDSIMIGSFLNVNAVGQYSVAIRIVLVSSIFFQVTNAVFGPKVAAMFANNQKNEMEDMIQKISKTLIILALLFLGTIIIVGKSILGIWGAEFINAYWALIILSTGQLVAISTGSVGLVLTFCNQEKKYGYMMFLSVIINIILNIALINIWGINGAALATAFSRILINIIGIVIVKKHVGIYTIPFFNKYLS